MDKNELQVNLNYLVSKYIKDDRLKEHLMIQIDICKAKYVLAEIDQNKAETYSEADINLIKNIAFHFC